ncbi:MAG: S8 family serine peptidase, partial [Verrucomicrobiota bacterium]
AALTNLLIFNHESPLISNNSWGYGARSYNSAAASYDMAVRDAVPGMSGSQPVAYVFAAGNSGGGSDNGQGGGPVSVTSPATAKNVITVGALESFRNITNDIIRPNRSCVILTNKEFLGSTDSSNQVAGFSSRGNVGVSLEGTYGRFKPDLVAPGTFIVSTRSQQLDEGAYYSTTNYEVQTFPNLVINPGDTNRFSFFIPDNPCDQGRARSYSIETLPAGGSPNPLPILSIYVNDAQNPSGNAANLRGTNGVFISEGGPGFFRGTTVYYDIVNTNGFEVGYTLHTEIVVTNDFGNYFKELKGLNDALGTNYFFESGSSMAAAAVSGMLALMQEFFEQKLPAGMRRTNSPAMMKALLINSARTPNDLLYKFETARSLNIPGWGLPNLSRILPDVLASEPDTNKWPIQFFDQSPVNALATGESHTRTVTVANTNAPLRITLVWTDPPGNPQVGVKLVNDLDLVVKTIVTSAQGTNTAISTNIYFGNNFPGGSQFSDPVDLGTNTLSSFDSSRDVVNNVENVYINGPLSTTYEVSVVARRVNVNAVRNHTNGIVQDYALVISSGNLTTNAPFAVAPAAPFLAANPNAFVTNFTTVATNGISLLNQRVGANAPLLNINGTGLSDGVTNQWNFYAINAGSLPYVAFFTFLTPNVSGTSDVIPNSRRNKEADIDMYVSTDPSLTNLNPAAIANADKSRLRGGQELIVYTNANAPIFYVGIKSEDQQGAEYNFFGIASDTPFSDEDANGNLILRGLITPGNSEIPDGSPEKPGGAYFLAFATKPIMVSRVVVTNTFTHERIGDLLGTLTHDEIFTVLNNHSFPVSPSYPDGQESGTFTGVYDDSELTGSDGIIGSRHTDGPGNLTDFIGQEGVGAWILTMEDNAMNATGRVDYLSIFVERALETNQLFGADGFTISSFQLAPNSSAGLSFIVPEGATNMIISIAPKEGPIDTVVRRGPRIATRTSPGTGYVDKGKIIDPPGGTLTLGTNDVPPLKPGRYSLRLFNDTAAPVTISGFVQF